MQDVWLTLTHLFNWKFLAILGSLLAAAFLVPARYLKPFRSVRINIVLFLIIAVISSVGTFYPQEQANLIYHSWWFSVLLALMSFNVIVCKLHSFPQRIHGKMTQREMGRISKPEDVFIKSKHKADFSTSRNVDEASRALRSWMKEKGLTYTEGQAEKLKEGSRLFVAGRHRFQRWGDFILHVSIVVLLAGSLMGALFGFEEFLPIPEGSTLTLKNRPYDVKLENFDIEYYKNTSAPSLYASNLLVTEEGKTLAQKRIVVNEPLDIKRVRFYQASWGMTPDFSLARLRMAGRQFEMKRGEVVKIDGTPFSVRANRFMPSFGMDAAGQPETKDFEGNNPALQIDFLKDEKTLGRLWVLKNDPHTAYRIEGDRLEQVPPPPLRLLEVEPLLFSGIQVKYDPGAPLFWTGALFLLAGLALHFYMHQRRLRILVLPTGRVLVGGWNSRTPEEFEREFSAWVSEIKGRLA